MAITITSDYSIAYAPLRVPLVHDLGKQCKRGSVHLQQGFICMLEGAPNGDKSLRVLLQSESISYLGDSRSPVYGE